MLRTIIPAIIMLIMAPAAALYSQCLTAPSPDPCTGVEPTVSSSEILTGGVKKFYYGPTATLNNVTLRGGTLVICTNVQINNLTLDSGIIMIRPGAKLIVSNGSSLMLHGNAAIYNYGTLEIWNHLQLEPNWPGITQPSVVINATTTSMLTVGNNYITINEPTARLVNNGRIDAYGIVTDVNSGVGSVCLGYTSQTNMKYLFQRKKFSFASPSGPSCVRINDMSELRDTLTGNHNVNLCLGPSHTQSACGGCKLNAWGTTYINTFCTDCATITLLDEQPRNQVLVRSERRNFIQATPNPFTSAIKITWSGNKKPTGITIINTTGAVVYSTTLRADPSGEVIVPMPASLPVGAYVVKVTYPGEVLLQKMIKQQF